MTAFLRLFGGALGALIAVVLAGGADIPPLDLSSIGGALLLVRLGRRLVRDRLLDPALRHRRCRRAG